MPGQTAQFPNGKMYGMSLENLEHELDKVNAEFLQDDNYSNVEDLEEKLTQFKAKFIECDRDLSGDLDLMDLKYMLEKLGQPKTHLELKKLIKQVDLNNSGTIHYNEFILMMLGKTSVLRMILLFEDKQKEAEKPTGVAPKKSIADLP
ncbi:allograft inflammatory factor 1-like [Watersipora subatra]|uniref:allograft inflammatory factor 1-like n=1 Tax=Watersipora subatra TaxID=2589382 RepID=UPI00355C8D78